MIQKLIKNWVTSEKMDYKVVLILLLFKKISDDWERDYKKACQDVMQLGIVEEEAREEAKRGEYHFIHLDDRFLWQSIRKDTSNLLENISTAIKSIAENNKNLSGIEELVDFIHFSSSEDQDKIRRLFEEMSGHDTSNVNFAEIINYIIIQHSLTEAKKGGIYTPKEIISLLSHILEPKPHESIYDPSSGYGEFLLTAFKFNEQENDGGELFLFGEEEKREQYLISKMNLALNGKIDAEIARLNSLLYPFKEGNSFKRFDVVLSNPEWNQRNCDEDVLKTGEFWKHRYKYGFPPKRFGDWAWIQHMAASAKNDTGRIAVVMDNGCLFRSGKEKTIRASVLEDDLIETVILLPEKLFYSNKGAPSTIMILRKRKPENKKHKVLFVNALQELGKHPKFKRLNILQESHIQKIAGACKQWEEIEGFSKIVEISEIKEQDYNLNVTLYVWPKEEVEYIDIAKEWTETEGVEHDLPALNRKIEGYLKELGIRT